MVGKEIAAILIALAFLPMAAANGLSVQPGSLQVNKTADQDTTISLNITNEESFPFYNVTFVANEHITFPKITTLASGETQQVTATISSQNSVNQAFKVRGLFESEVGTGNQSYDVSVNFENGIDVCQISGVVGDEVTWHNVVADQIVMRNADTNNDITTIQQGGMHSVTFDAPVTLNYYFLRLGFQFTNTCTVHMAGSEGFVTDPALDGVLNLQVDVIFEPTEVQLTVLETDYSMEFFQTDEGVMQIKNIGSNKAENIHLSGEWLSFSENDFDLTVGQSKGVIYTISPDITESNQTGKTHIINITAEGNFPKKEVSLSVFIEEANINSGLNGTSAGLLELIQAFCQENPEICRGENIIIQGGNGTSLVGVNFTADEVKGLFKLMFDLRDMVTRQENKDADLKSQIFEFFNKTSEDVSEIRNITVSQEAEQERRNNRTAIAMVLVVVVLMGLIILGLIYLYKQKQKRDLLKQW